MTKEKALRDKEIRHKLKLAKVYLKSSRNSLRVKDIRLATDAAYNSAELAMKATILLQKEAVPRRHGGITQLFSLLYVKDGPLDRKLGSVISTALEFRNQARYVPDTEITKKHAAHNIELAEELIKFLGKELGTKGAQRSNFGFIPLGVLVALAVLVAAAGGVVVWKSDFLWERKVKPTPTPTPAFIITPTPTISSAWTQPCESDNDCPKQMCQPPDQPCSQYYCIQGKCQLVEPPVNKQEEITGSLNEKIKLTPGQRVNIANTNLSLTLLKITTPAPNCFDCPTTAEIEVRSGTSSEKIYFTVGVLATEEVERKLRQKDIFGFRITMQELRPEYIVLIVQKL